MTARRSSPPPERVIGVAGMAFAAFNGVVGMGIFALPGLIAGLIGPAAILAYLGCLLILGLVALCMAEAGSRVEASGGVYAYAHAAFGPVVAGIAGTLAFFANGLASSAALARFFLDTVGRFSPALAPPVRGYALLTALLGLLAIANVRGARQGARLTVAVSVIKIAPLALLAIVGLCSLHPRTLSFGPLPTFDKLEQAMLLLFFAFTGVETGTYLSGEIRRPARTVPRAILLAIAMVALLYLALQVVARNALGTSLAGSHQPLVEAGQAVLGPRGAALLLATTLLSVGGHIVADSLCSPRLLYALAERGQVPRALAFVHPRFGTPAAAILLYPLLVTVVAASGTFRQIAVVSTTGTLLLYLLTCLGVLRLRAKRVAQAGKPFVVPGGAAIPLAASALIVWLLVGGLHREELTATTVLVLAIGAIYAGPVSCGEGCCAALRSLQRSRICPTRMPARVHARSSSCTVPSLWRCRA